MTDCLCKAAVPLVGEPLIASLAAVRESCPALRDLYLPADTWPAFRSWHATPDPVALHHSILALALDRGHLVRLTEPVHRYLLHGGAVAAGLRAQYVEDLKERWMLTADPLRRHQRCRIYLGRITELQVAQWLESQGWTVSELEAFREGSDVTAVHESLCATDFEIKMVGTEDGDFESIVKSLAGQPAARVLSPYAAVNYLLFRIYEAATQLRRSSRRRVAIVVAESWDRFQMQLEGSWIDWRTPRFMKQDGESLGYIHSQRDRYPGIDSDSALAWIPTPRVRPNKTTG